MEIHKYSIYFMEEVYFSTQEINTFFITKPIIGNYAMNYALGWCKSLYDQTEITYKEDFEKVNDEGLYVTPAIIKNPKYTMFTFNALSDGYYNKMERALSNYPQKGEIKALSVGNIGEGFIFSEKPLKKINYLRLGKFMGKAKVIYEKCEFEVLNGEYKCFGYVNSVDLSEEFDVKSFELINMHPVPVFKDLTGCGEVYKINTKDGIVYYPTKVRLGG